MGSYSRNKRRMVACGRCARLVRESETHKDGIVSLCRNCPVQAAGPSEKAAERERRLGNGAGRAKRGEAE